LHTCSISIVNPDHLGAKAMKKAMFFLLVTAATATAEDRIYSRTEYRGHIRDWPPVVEAREAYRRCPAEDHAIITSQRIALTYATPSLSRPLVGSTPVVAPPAQPIPPAPLPPMTPVTPQPSTPRR
jgi:hypothetical protein